MNKTLIFCNNWYPFIGGVTTHIEQLVTGMPEYSFDIIVNAAGDLPTSEKFLDNGTIHRLKPNDLSILHPGYDKLPKILYPSILFSALSRVRKKNKLMRNSGSDILHFHGPVIEPNFFYLDTKLRTRFFSSRLKPSCFRGKKIITCHGLASHYNSKVWTLEKDLLNQFDAIICVDEYIFSDAKKMVSDHEIIYFIPNSINVHEFPFKNLVLSEKLTIGYVGRLSVERGFSLVESLIKNKPDYVKLIIVVAGSEKKINEIRSKWKSNDIEIHTNVSPSGMPELIWKMDILLNPVSYEGSSRATLEAFSCGRPAIMIDVGNRYPVINGETGFIVKNDIASLLKILNSINSDKQVLIRMSENARKVVEAEFSNEVIIPKIKKIYEGARRSKP